MPPLRPEKPATPDPRARAGAESPVWRRRRWVIAVVLVVLVHVLAVVGFLRMPGPLIPLDVTDTPTLEAVLLPPPKPPAPPKPRPAPQPRPKPAAPAPAPQPEPEPPAPPLATSPQGPTEMATGSGGPGAAPAPPAAPAPAPSGGPQGGVDGVVYSAPPPATFHYASYVNGVQNPDGQIRWEHDGRRYRLAVETRVLWFRFAFQSSGALSEQGLLPERYEEHRRNKAESSRFDPAAGTAVLGNGAQSPFPAGAQDRFSVFLQLVGLVRGNPQRYATPGVTETFQVADTRNVEPMQVQYVGEEEIDTGNGVIRAKHFVRMPRRANDRRRVELWLAQSLGWMPVRLRQTEPDGTQIDLVYRGNGGQ